MGKIEIVVGANFGDEGKGLMTDFFCERFSHTGSVLNVRHNGGGQAGHTVVTPDGKRHVFSHFGAGSFVPHVATYLSSEFILNPMIFCRELEELKSKYGIAPKVYVNPNCRITTPYDMLINQIAERHRGKDRHGSCGLGINETIVRDQKYPIRFGALRNRPMLIAHIMPMLLDMRCNYLPDRLWNLGVYDIPEQDADLIVNDNILKNYIVQLYEMLLYCEIADDTIIKKFDNIVFEGAQGLLLDTDFVQFAPNLTSSKTGSINPKNILVGLGMQDREIEVCYVTRAYFTRHGAGAFPTECQKAEMLSASVMDKTNHYNEFQERFRYGWFDDSLFESETERDFLYRKSEFPNLTAVRAVTHLDETGEHVLRVDPKDCDLPFGTVYRSCGETRNNVKME